MGTNIPPVDPAFNNELRRHNLNGLLRALPDRHAFSIDIALVDIRLRMAQVTGAMPFLDAGEQALAGEWLAAARESFDALQGSTER